MTEGEDKLTFNSVYSSDTLGALIPSVFPSTCLGQTAEFQMLHQDAVNHCKVEEEGRRELQEVSHGIQSNLDIPS